VLLGRSHILRLMRTIGMMDPLFLVCFDQEDRFAPCGVEQEAPRLGRAPRAPSSPWMPFSMLFAAISTKVPRSDMELVIRYYEEFKVVGVLFLSFEVSV
jgi:hypothetical protein